MPTDPSEQETKSAAGKTESPEEDAADAETEAPPMNRAERRLAAKGKRGSQPSGRAGQPGNAPRGGAMRGQTFRGSGTPSKGTNTRRSG